MRTKNTNNTQYIEIYDLLLMVSIFHGKCRVFSVKVYPAFFCLDFVNFPNEKVEYIALYSLHESVIFSF